MCTFLFIILSIPTFFIIACSSLAKHLAEWTSLGFEREEDGGRESTGNDKEVERAVAGTGVQGS